ncbi:hypothetical protein [Aeromicrobium sp. CTD01-1L150]|uniref:hypothetical protein n=1 Tax=Aeromicrobium sp. CTD01-1L150 TaxID=3341830 RepID=UPI0035BF5C7E
MVKRIVAAVFASAVVLMPMSAPATAAEKAPSSKAIDWEAPGKSGGLASTFAIDWD